MEDASEPTLTLPPAKRFVFIEIFPFYSFGLNNFIIPVELQPCQVDPSKLSVDFQKNSY